MAQSQLSPLTDSILRAHLQNVCLYSVTFSKQLILGYVQVGAAQGINQAAQCVGAILIAPLIKQWPTRTVLSCAIFVFALMTTILLIVDASTGENTGIPV